jgi:hypothetical protein
MTVRTRTFGPAQIATTAALEVYTAGTGFVGRIDKFTLVNTTTNDVTACKVFVGGTGTGDQIVTDLTVPAQDEVQVAVANHAIQAGDALNVQVGTATAINYYVTITERTQRTT